MFEPPARLERKITKIRISKKNNFSLCIFSASGLNPWDWTIKVSMMDRGIKGYSSVRPWLQIHLGVNISAKSAIGSSYTLFQ